MDLHPSFLFVFFFFELTFVNMTILILDYALLLVVFLSFRMETSEFLHPFGASALFSVDVNSPAF